MGISQEDLDSIKVKVAALHQNNKEIHLSVNSGRTKVDNAVSYIVGVYKNFFAVKSQVKNYYEQFTFKYVEILTKKVIIKELEM